MRPTPHAGGRGPVEPVRVVVVAADPVQRQRLVELLATVPGIEVAGWVDHPESLQELGADAAERFVLVHAESDDRTAPDGGRPRLARRQRDVLIAYTGGNDLISVLARQIGMTPETFRTHLRRIRVKYEKAGRPAPTRRDLYVRAVEDGLVPPPS